MQFPSLLGHIQELVGIILESKEPSRHRGKPADSLIDWFFHARKYLGSHDRRFIAETTYGVLRHLRRCEHELQKALPISLREISPQDRSLLLVVTYLVLVQNHPDVPVEAISSRVGSNRLQPYLPDLVKSLAMAKEDQAQVVTEHLGLQSSFPDWMIKKFLEQFGVKETEALCRSLNEQGPLTLRVNTLKTTVEECRNLLREEGVETVRTRLSPFGLHVPKRLNIFALKPFKDGLFEVQDEGSQLLPILVDPKPTAKVLDACAGAGGKSLELSALMKNRGEIFSTDLNGYRLDQLRKRARRAGAFNIRVKEIDSIDGLKSEFSEVFDDVLVDAPCSGLGTIRRNPGMKWSVTELTVKEVSQKQIHILDASSRLIKTGGQLAYATCTLLREENENIVESFLERHPNFRLVEKDELLKKLNLPSRSDGRYIKFLPHREGTDGFFFAIMKKHGS